MFLFSQNVFSRVGYKMASTLDQNDVRIFKIYPLQIFEHPSKYGKTLKRLYFTNS